MNEEEKQEIKELINLLYNNHISQYGKRKLENYIKKLQKELDKKDKVIDLIITDYLNLSKERISKEEFKKWYFDLVGIKKVEVEND